MENIPNQLTGNNACYEIIQACHTLLDQARVEHLPDYPEGERLIKRLERLLDQMTLGATEIDKLLKQLAELSKTDDNQ